MDLPSGPGCGRLTRISRPASLRQALRPGDGLQKCGGAFGLKDERHLHAAGDADRAAVVLGDGDGDDGTHQDLLLAEGRGDGGLQFRGVEAIGLEPLLEHGERKVAIGADADGAA